MYTHMNVTPINKVSLCFWNVIWKDVENLKWDCAKMSFCLTSWVSWWNVGGNLEGLCLLGPEVLAIHHFGDPNLCPKFMSKIAQKNAAHLGGCAPPKISLRVAPNCGRTIYCFEQDLSWCSRYPCHVTYKKIISFAMSFTLCDDRRVWFLVLKTNDTKHLDKNLS